MQCACRLGRLPSICSVLLDSDLLRAQSNSALGRRPAVPSHRGQSRLRPSHSKPAAVRHQKLLVGIGAPMPAVCPHTCACISVEIHHRSSALANVMTALSMRRYHLKAIDPPCSQDAWIQLLQSIQIFDRSTQESHLQHGELMCSAVSERDNALPSFLRNFLCTPHAHSARHTVLPAPAA